MSARRKGAAIAAPSTYAEAVAVATSYGAEERRALRMKAFAEERIAKIKAELSGDLATIAADNETRFAQLRAWWAVAAGDLAKGRKSFELGGVTIGDRKSTPKLALAAKQKMADAIEWLKARDLGGFIRTKEELDKPALLKALSVKGGGRLLLEPMFVSRQKDEFFIAVGNPAERPVVVPEGTA